MSTVSGGNGHSVWRVLERSSFPYKLAQLSPSEVAAVQRAALALAAERVLPALTDKRDMLPPSWWVYRRHIPEVDLWLLYDVSPKHGTLILISVKRSTARFWF